MLKKKEFARAQMEGLLLQTARLQERDKEENHAKVEEKRKNDSDTEDSIKPREMSPPPLERSRSITPDTGSRSRRDLKTVVGGTARPVLEGCCDWCLRVSPPQFNLPVTDSDEVKLFCSETCFGHYRRAVFKVGRGTGNLCDNCKQTRQETIVVQDNLRKFNFCSSTCLNQFRDGQTSPSSLQPLLPDASDHPIVKVKPEHLLKHPDIKKRESELRKPKPAPVRKPQVRDRQSDRQRRVEGELSRINHPQHNQLTSTRVQELARVQMEGLILQKPRLVEREQEDPGEQENKNVDNDAEESDNTVREESSPPPLERSRSITPETSSRSCRDLGLALEGATVHLTSEDGSTQGRRRDLLIEGPDANLAGEEGSAQRDDNSVPEAGRSLNKDKGCCDWCLRVSPPQFNLPVTDSDEVKLFCSETCFGHYRRAVFKVGRGTGNICDNCKQTRQETIVVQDNLRKLNFCSSSCRNQYLDGQTSPGKQSSNMAGHSETAEHPTVKVKPDHLLKPPENKLRESELRRPKPAPVRKPQVRDRQSDRQRRVEGELSRINHPQHNQLTSSRVQVANQLERLGLHQLLTTGGVHNNNATGQQNMIQFLLSNPPQPAIIVPPPSANPPVPMGPPPPPPPVRVNHEVKHFPVVNMLNLPFPLILPIPVPVPIPIPIPLPAAATPPSLAAAAIPVKEEKLDPCRSSAPSKEKILQKQKRKICETPEEERNRKTKSLKIKREDYSCEAVQNSTEETSQVRSACASPSSLPEDMEARKRRTLIMD